MHTFSTESLDPIDEIDGYLVKRGDAFCLGHHVGSKVRQCLHLVGHRLQNIREHHNNGICTGAGLPSPQIAIVAGVAKAYGLSCSVTTPWFAEHARDVNRINASLAQREGACVYGVGNPNPSGYLRDVEELVRETGYLPIRFGMCGDKAMEPVIEQVANVPGHVKQIVVIAGSGLTALGVLLGLARFQKPVKQVFVVTLSGHYQQNKAAWYDPRPASEKFAGDVVVASSPYEYRKLVKATPWDWTYESKAWVWMKNNLQPDGNTLFWVVGSRCYDLSLIEPIRWHFTKHETQLQADRHRRRNTSTGSVLSPPRRTLDNSISNVPCCTKPSSAATRSTSSTIE